MNSLDIKIISPDIKMNSADCSGADISFDEDTEFNLSVELKNESHELLPHSKERYLQAFDRFVSWQKKQKTTSFSVNVMLPYFQQLSEKLAPTTLWSVFSMIKTVIKEKHEVDIGYPELISFLKHSAAGYSKKKTKLFKAVEILKFLHDASDSEYLDVKVTVIFGILGAVKMDEMINITVDQVENRDNSLLVKIPKIKNKESKSFILDSCKGYYETVKKYQLLRPKNVRTDRFFLNYQKKRCTKQPIGINKFRNMPKIIAKFLGLPNAKLYTGHSFRKINASWFANAGTDIDRLKRHKCLKSQPIVESHVEESLQYKEKEGNISSSSYSEVNISDNTTPAVINSTNSSSSTAVINQISAQKLINQIPVQVSKDHVILQFKDNNVSHKFRNCVHDDDNNNSNNNTNGGGPPP